jgi:hypothetical protein
MPSNQTKLSFCCFVLALMVLACPSVVVAEMTFHLGVSTVYIATGLGTAGLCFDGINIITSTWAILGYIYYTMYNTLSMVLTLAWIWTPNFVVVALTRMAGLTMAVLNFLRIPKFLSYCTFAFLVPSVSYIAGCLRWGSLTAGFTEVPVLIAALKGTCTLNVLVMPVDTPRWRSFLRNCVVFDPKHNLLVTPHFKPATDFGKRLAAFRRIAHQHRQKGDLKTSDYDVIVSIFMAGVMNSIPLLKTKNKRRRALYEVGMTIVRTLLDCDSTSLTLPQVTLATLGTLIMADDQFNCANAVNAYYRYFTAVYEDDPKRENVVCNDISKYQKAFAILVAIIRVDYEHPEDGPVLLEASTACECKYCDHMRWCAGLLSMPFPPSSLFCLKLRSLPPDAETAVTGADYFSVNACSNKKYSTIVVKISLLDERLYSSVAVFDPYKDHTWNIVRHWFDLHTSNFPALVREIGVKENKRFIATTPRDDTRMYYSPCAIARNSLWQRLTFRKSEFPEYLNLDTYYLDLDLTKNVPDYWVFTEGGGVKKRLKRQAAAAAASNSAAADDVLPTSWTGNWADIDPMGFWDQAAAEADFHNNYEIDGEGGGAMTFDDMMDRFEMLYGRAMVNDCYDKYGEEAGDYLDWFKKGKKGKKFTRSSRPESKKKSTAPSSVTGAIRTRMEEEPFPMERVAAGFAARIDAPIPNVETLPPSHRAFLTRVNAHFMERHPDAVPPRSQAPSPPTLSRSVSFSVGTPATPTIPSQVAFPEARVAMKDRQQQTESVTVVKVQEASKSDDESEADVDGGKKKKKRNRKRGVSQPGTPTVIVDAIKPESAVAGGAKFATDNVFEVSCPFSRARVTAVKHGDTKFLCIPLCLVIDYSMVMKPLTTYSDVAAYLKEVNLTFVDHALSYKCDFSAYPAKYVPHVLESVQCRDGQTVQAWLGFVLAPVSLFAGLPVPATLRETKPATLDAVTMGLANGFIATGIIDGTCDHTAATDVGDCGTALMQRGYPVGIHVAGASARKGRNKFVAFPESSGSWQVRGATHTAAVARVDPTA